MIATTADSRNQQQRQIGERITQYMRDLVVRDAAQPGLQQHQPVEQPDHRYGDQQQEDLHRADYEDIEQGPPPGRAVRDADCAEDADRLSRHCLLQVRVRAAAATCVLPPELMRSAEASEQSSDQAHASPQS